jgi:hypothetical protein
MEMEPMNFVHATTRLIEPLTLEDLAREIGVSHGLLRQSRLSTANPSYRAPPDGWEAAVAALARKRAAELERLATQFAGSSPRSARKPAKGRRKAAAKKTGRKKRAARR